MSKDVFPMLELEELVVCLQSCDFSMASENSILRPTSQYVTTLYKQIIDSFMGISPDDLSKFDNEIEGFKLGVNNFDTRLKDTLSVLTLNKVCYKFFCDVGVSDFSLMDLFKPDPYRTRRLLSAVVNYARFREERMFDCDQFMSITETLLGEIRQKFDDHNFLRRQVDRYRGVEGMEGQDDVTTLEDENKNLETQLKNLTHVQEAFTIDYNTYKSNKQALLSELESLGYQLIELESQRDKLKRYTETDLPTLERSLTELRTVLQQQHQKLSELEWRQRKILISGKTFTSIMSQVYDVLQVISTDIQESHMKESGLIDLKEQISQSADKLQNLLTSGVLVKISIVQSQLDHHQEKLGELKESTTAKQQENKKAIEMLQHEYSKEILPELQLTEERIEKEIMAGVMKDLESEIRNLKAQFQRESDAIELEYSLLASHINKYIESVLQKMDQG
ncbi:LAMI_0H19614g1_1 [Lachancea mirantina]|uniref:LAMI_0H19614g1_1 n=1 Tax=Lachancea mirantina TaxID=1230905 RepID=A0A1G4KJU1_9SACH|nr:LAMI_0H19614g1_1 [Lachancea mirantina]